MRDRPRCEGCGHFVSPSGYHPADCRWCQRCADALPLEQYRRQTMTDRIEAERFGWPMWPLSDVLGHGRAAMSRHEVLYGHPTTTPRGAQR